MRKIVQTTLLVPIVIGVILLAPARADEVTDWNQTLFRAGLVAGTSPLIITRVAAIVQASVFDAVNGIARRYAPIHVAPAGPAGASTKAAAAQAASTALVALFPTQKSTFDARLAVSMTEIGGTIATLDCSGRRVGDHSRQRILRGAHHGFYAGAASIPGRDRGWAVASDPARVAWAPGRSFSGDGSWVILAHDRSVPPVLALAAPVHQGFQRNKTMGSISTRRARPTRPWPHGSGRPAAPATTGTPCDILIDRGDDDGDHDWDHDGHSRHHSTLENARLFAQLNLATTDAAIGLGREVYVRLLAVVTAIPLADTDGNPATIADPAWMPLFATPAHPEYPSGHSCLSGAATAVLADQFGEHSHFTVTNDLMPGVERSFKSFTSALNEVKNARIFAGIHFRLATEDGTARGAKVADYVRENALQRVPWG